MLADSGEAVRQTPGEGARLPGGEAARAADRRGAEAPRPGEEQAAQPPADGSRAGRGRSGVSTQSSTIVLPELPRVPDVTGPLTAAGEVLVTGTIDLPAGLAETGEHPRNVYRPDRAVEGGDGVSSEFGPVSAVHAVGVYTTAQVSVTPEVKKESRLVASLPYVAGGMALIVVALIVAGFVFHVF